MTAFKKYRFTKQRTRIDCGPTVVVNLMKANGLKISYRFVAERLARKLKVATFGGTPKADLDRHLMRRRIPRSKFLFREENVRPEFLKQKLRENKRVVLAYYSSRFETGHTCLIIDHNNRGFVVVNYDKGPTVQTISFAKFKKDVVDFNDAVYYFFEGK
jgi:hypothetical protein